MAEENTFPGTGAQSLHVLDDNHIVGVRFVHDTSSVRIQKDDIGPNKTTDADIMTDGKSYIITYTLQRDRKTLIIAMIA